VDEFVGESASIHLTFQGEFADIDAMAENARTWDQKYEQLGRGAFEGRLEHVITSSLQFGRVRWSPGVLQRGSGPPDSWVLGFPIKAGGSIHLNGRPANMQSPLRVAPRGDIMFVANGPTDLLVVALPFDRIERWMHCRRGRDSLDRAELERAGAASGQELRRHGLMLARTLEALIANGATDRSGAAVACAEDRIFDAVLQFVPSGEIIEPLHRRARTAARLRDILLGNVETPLTISRMCEQLGVRERTLFLICMEAYGRSPAGLLLELRLNSARRALCSPDAETSVTSAAVRFGFLHFGHFSAEYRRQFGELPSATLSRSRGAPTEHRVAFHRGGGTGGELTNPRARA
jgi:AraC family ethanolamine operon transcriptional activator